MAHSEDVRAKVIAELLAGKGVMEVSRTLKLPKQTVSRIRNEMAPETLGQIGTEKAEQMESLIVNYLQSNFKAMKAICDIASDENYLKRQSASEVATLHAELATRAFRLLEAENAEGDNAP